MSSVRPTLAAACATDRFPGPHCRDGQRAANLAVACATDRHKSPTVKMSSVRPKQVPLARNNPYLKTLTLRGDVQRAAQAGAGARNRMLLVC